ncbi:3'-5' exonuclease [Agarivorans gilvus]|uniref:Exonuclease domain-containing protein n=1 Tax=Agarivorans gilvus TaxID=680279 RepID=A0ABQ1I2L4_9ALTE|nr:3'-5' exonuclease [Agarivorans gilvus]GGB05459.1 hypothetical protein GCM10007414_18500 [Agarivorans gilvus]
MALLVVDLETTCDEGEKLARTLMETIEIGAVVVDEQLQILGSFQSFIKPLRTPQLTAFCSDLTGISQAEVDSAATVYEVFPEFADWLSGFAGLKHWASWHKRRLCAELKRCWAEALGLLGGL